MKQKSEPLTGLAWGSLLLGGISASILTTEVSIFVGSVTVVGWSDFLDDLAEDLSELLILARLPPSELAYVLILRFKDSGIVSGFDAFRPDFFKEFRRL